MEGHGRPRKATEGLGMAEIWGDMHLLLGREGVLGPVLVQALRSPLHDIAQVLGDVGDLLSDL